MCWGTRSSRGASAWWRGRWTPPPPPKCRTPSRHGSSGARRPWPAGAARVAARGRPDRPAACVRHPLQRQRLLRPRGGPRSARKVERGKGWAARPRRHLRRKWMACELQRFALRMRMYTLSFHLNQRPSPQARPPPHPPHPPPRHPHARLRRLAGGEWWPSGAAPAWIPLTWQLCW